MYQTKFRCVIWYQNSAWKVILLGFIDRSAIGCLLLKWIAILSHIIIWILVWEYHSFKFSFLDFLLWYGSFSFLSSLFLPSSVQFCQLSFNFNFNSNLVESWVSINTIFNTHPSYHPTTHPPLQEKSKNTWKWYLKIRKRSWNLWGKSIFGFHIIILSGIDFVLIFCPLRPIPRLLLKLIFKWDQDMSTNKISNETNTKTGLNLKSLSRPRPILGLDIPGLEFWDQDQESCWTLDKLLTELSLFSKTW